MEVRLGNGVTGGAEPQIVEAVVQVGAEETRYLRCGRSGSVVLVVALEDDERLRLLRLLAAARRVIAPVPPALSDSPTAWSGADLGAWLRNVVEGLGLDRPALVLEAALAALAPAVDAVAGDAIGPCMVAADAGTADAGTADAGSGRRWQTGGAAQTAATSELPNPGSLRGLGNPDVI
jgi:hypothetical protein